MKRSIVSAAMLLAGCMLCAFGPMQMLATMGVPCSTPAVGTYWTEGVEGAGYETAVTEYGAPDEDFTAPGALSGGCSQAMRLNIPDGVETGIYRNHGSLIDLDTVTVDYKFSIWIETGLQSGQTIAVGGVGDSSGLASDESQINYNYNGTIHRIQAYTTGSQSVFVTLSLDTWYDVIVHYDTTPGSSYFKVVGGGSTTCDTASECLFTRVAGLDAQYFFYGAGIGVGAGETADIVIDKMGY